ncbi:MAG: hypothetical protein GY822_02095 [Deltaproteobacteria bacterium]|nr:hypothetical protein [Deltaproteobacteria bacterium]
MFLNDFFRIDRPPLKTRFSPQYLLVTLLLIASALVTGCYSRVVRMPGVLDLQRYSRRVDAVTPLRNTTSKPSKIASLYPYKSGLRQLTGRAPEHRAYQAQVINPHEHRCTSDGSGLEGSIPTDLPERKGIYGVIAGNGAQIVDDKVVIQKSEAWALGFPVFNADSTEEIIAALNQNVLCKVTIVEEVDSTDVMLYFIKLVSVVDLIGGWATPTFTGTITAVPKRAPELAAQKLKTKLDVVKTPSKVAP